MENTVGTNEFDFSPSVNLVRYLQRIKNFPILRQEEEYELATAYKATKDKKLAYKLITSHLRLVVKIVAQYKGYGLSVGEMISEGNMGLIHAIEGFDPEKGFRFSTYAMWWIRASVQKYILSSWSLVKIGTTSAQKKLFFNLRKVKNNLSLLDDRELTPEVLQEIAQALDVSVKDVLDMNVRMRSHDSSLNVLVDETSETSQEWIDFISDSKPNQEESLGHTQQMIKRKEAFSQALSCLNEREKDILFKRRMCEKTITLDDLSKVYQISKERVRQIELNSVKKMQEYVLNFAKI